MLKCQSGNKRLRIDKIPLIKVDFRKTEMLRLLDNYEPPRTQPTDKLTSLHDFGKHLILPGCIERHKIHTTISAEIASIEPVPVLKIRLV